MNNENRGIDMKRKYKVDITQPLFLKIEVKDEETKKYLDSLFVPRKQKLDIKDNGVVFIRSPEGTIVEVTTIEKLCDKLAKEIR